MRRDLAILLLAIGQTLVWASIYYAFPALLLRWEQETGWSKADLTFAITLAVLISAAASPLAGRLIDRGLGAPMMGGAAATGGIGLFLLAQVSELWQFYALWALIGLSMAGCLYDASFSMVTRARGARARRGIIAVTLVAGFASTLSYPVYFTLSEAQGWRDAVKTVAIAEVFLIAPLLYAAASLLENEGRARPAEPEEAAATDRRFMRRREFWFLAVAFCCVALPHGAALQHFLPLMDERGFRPEDAVFAASFIGPMQVAGRLAMVGVGRYLSNRGVALAAFGALCLSMFCLYAGGGTPVFVAGFVLLFGSAYGTVSILRPLLVREILGERNFGAKSGALALPYLAGAALAPYCGSLLWVQGGYDLMLLTLIGTGAIGAVFFHRASRTRP